MIPLLDQARQLIDAASAEERGAILKYLRERTAIHPLETEWGTSAEAILSAIARSSDLTQRGVRGILAESVFADRVVPTMAASGWNSLPIHGELPYDFILERNKKRVRIQVKLQRRERGAPKQLSKRLHTQLKNAPNMLYVVEVQKTRSGEKSGNQTRPYRFGDFDIIAVNLHPSTGVWEKFHYTVGDWLLPRPATPELIQIFQPVPSAPDQFWTDDLNLCISWFFQRKRKRLYS